MAVELNLDLSNANPKQIQFFKARNRFINYGGARGGGKSWSVRHKAIMLALNYPGIKMLLLRRTYPDLRENHINELKKILKGFVQFSELEKTFKFQNGSALKMGYCASESDVLQYQGQEYDVIFMDEATQFTEFQFETLTACVRGANRFPKRMYLTCNPGGVGHTWVKRLFIDKEYRNKEKPEDYLFIPATVFDNKVLIENDPDYVDMLNNLSEDLRLAWRDGNWDLLAGQYFDEFNREIHVVEPFEVPEHWHRYRAIDYGLDCLACIWVAVDELNQMWVYREYAEEDKIISEGARDIIDLSGDEKIIYTVAPPDLWSRSQESAKSKVDLFREHGLPLLRGSNNREAGWLAVKELLKIHNVTEELKESRLHIFSNCTKLIKYIPSLQRDNKKPTDCMTEPHEITHLPDALRYFALQYIYPAREKQEKTELQRYKEKVLKSKRERKGSWY